MEYQCVLSLRVTALDDRSEISSIGIALAGDVNIGDGLRGVVLENVPAGAEKDRRSG